MRLGVLATHPIQYHAPLYRELARRLDLHVYFAHRQTPQGQAAAGFGVEFEWDVPLLDGYEHTFLKNRARRPDVSTFFGCSTPDIDSIIAHGQHDSFLVTGWHTLAFTQAIRACWSSSTPIMVRGDSQLVTPRSGIKRAAKELGYRWFIPRFDRYLVVGERSREYYLHYGADPDRMHFVPHFVDNDWFRKRSLSADSHRVRAELSIPREASIALFVGKLIPKKRPADLLRALASMADRERPWTAVFVGSGPLEDHLQQEAAQLGVDARFAGFKNQSELPRYYAAADVLVLPSDGGETWGLVVNEGMACGLPAVVSDAAGCAPDLIDDGRTGYTFALGNVSALAIALRQAVGMKHDERVQRVMRAKLDIYSVGVAADGVIEAIEAAHA